MSDKMDPAVSEETSNVSVSSMIKMMETNGSNKLIQINSQTVKQSKPLVTATKQSTPLVTATKQSTPLVTATKQSIPLVTATKQSKPLVTATKQSKPLVTHTKPKKTIFTATEQSTPLVTATKSEFSKADTASGHCIWPLHSSVNTKSGGKEVRKRASAWPPTAVCNGVTDAGQNIESKEADNTSVLHANNNVTLAPNTSVSIEASENRPSDTRANKEDQSTVIKHSANTSRTTTTSKENTSRTTTTGKENTSAISDTDIVAAVEKSYAGIVAVESATRPKEEEVKYGISMEHLLLLGSGNDTILSESTTDDLDDEHIYELIACKCS